MFYIQKQRKACLFNGTFCKVGCCVRFCIDGLLLSWNKLEKELQNVVNSKCYNCILVWNWSLAVPGFLC